MRGGGSFAWGVCGVAFFLAACASQPCVMPEGPRLKAASAAQREDTGDASEQRAVISYGGQHCEFYLHEVENSLRKVPGVKTLDFRAIKDHVVVTYELGKASPSSLLNAINSVKGEDYYCKGKIIPG
jgi:hypothetical protein